MDPEQLFNQLKNKINPEAQFRDSLRLRLLRSAQNKKINNSYTNMTQNKTRLLLMFTTALAVAIVALVVQNNQIPSLNNQVSAREGFGKLPSFNTTAAESGTATDAATDNSVGLADLGRGGSGGVAPSTIFDLKGRFDSGGGGGMPAPDLIIAPDGEFLPPKVTYTWSGELPEIEPEMLVFRNRPLNLSNDFMRNIYNLTGLDVFRNLSGVTLENVSIADANSSYRYNIEYGGRFGIWSNKQYDYREIPASQRPSDRELISIAENFLRSRGINTDDFGEPYVEDFAWGRPIPFATESGVVEDDAATRLVYPGVTVNYPSAIDGKPVVYWDGRNDPGISVNINIPSREVTGVNGRWNLPKDQSLYPTANKESVIEYVLRGGLNALWGSEGTVGTLTPAQEARRPQINVNLDSVRLGYVQQHKYLPDSGTSEIYWIPVWAFSGEYTDQSGQTIPYGTLVPAIQSDLFEQPPFRILPAVDPKG